MADVAKDQAVTVAYVGNNMVHYSWHHSLFQLVAYDGVNSNRLRAGGFIAMRCGTNGLVEARNKAVQTFLEEDKADWLFWIDTDMGFEPDVVDRLFEAADPVKRPVVGALCFSWHEDEPDGMGGYRHTATPTVYDWAHVDGQYGWQVRWQYPANTLTPVGGTGAACVLIHRSVFEKIQAEHGRVWYDRIINTTTGQLIGEDLSFCLRAGALKIPMWVHTGVPTTHFKSFWLGEEDYWRQQGLKSLAESVAELAPDAERTWTVPRYAIVPTHDRPMRLHNLVVSLGQQVDHIVVLDNASNPPVDQEKLQASVPDRVTVEVIRDEQQPPHLSRFWNVMLDRCEVHSRGDRPYVAGMPPTWEYDVGVFNDDAVLPGGWFDATSEGLRSSGAVVAHTNPTSPALLSELHNDPNNRMCPHAFLLRGETGMRADEDMRWWYFDTDLDWRARLAGGVLSVPGPRVVNALANSTTVGPLAEQAQKDAATFEAKWSA